VRIIAGSRRSLPLKSLEGDITRPTLDRYKETLFNIIQADVPDSTFLDLFAGSGSVGLEALSRGARQAVFVDNNKRAVSVIQDNVAFTKFESQSRVIRMDALSYLGGLPTLDFDIIYIDPPYSSGLYADVMRLIAGKPMTPPECRIILEMALEDSIDFITDLNAMPGGRVHFELDKIKNYKTNKHVFIHAVRGNDE